MRATSPKGKKELHLHASPHFLLSTFHLWKVNLDFLSTLGLKAFIFLLFSMLTFLLAINLSLSFKSVCWWCFLCVSGHSVFGTWHDIYRLSGMFDTYKQTAVGNVQHITSWVLHFSQEELRSVWNIDRRKFHKLVLCHKSLWAEEICKCTVTVIHYYFCPSSFLFSCQSHICILKSQVMMMCNDAATKFVSLNLSWFFLFEHIIAMGGCLQLSLHVGARDMGDWIYE